MSSWGNGRLPGTGRGTQDGASADEGNAELAQVGLPVCPYVCPALSRSAAVPWHNDPGTVLSIPLLPCAPETAWASDSRASPTPAGQVLYSAVSLEGAERQEKKKVERREREPKIIFASLPVAMQSLIFTNEEKQPQHLSKYLNLPPCFLCALKK